MSNGRGIDELVSWPIYHMIQQKKVPSRRNAGDARDIKHIRKSIPQEVCVLLRNDQNIYHVRISMLRVIFSGVVVCCSSHVKLYVSMFRRRGVLFVACFHVSAALVHMHVYAYVYMYAYAHVYIF
jgi:hypothetical protein